MASLQIYTKNRNSSPTCKPIKKIFLGGLGLNASSCLPCERPCWYIKKRLKYKYITNAPAHPRTPTPSTHPLHPPKPNPRSASRSAYRLPLPLPYSLLLLTHSYSPTLTHSLLLTHLLLLTCSLLCTHSVIHSYSFSFTHSCSL